MLHFRHYTPEEANALRPWVAARVARLKEARDRLAASGAAPSADSDPGAGGGSYPGVEHARAAVAYALILEEFEERDIVVRDLDRGLIDFPSLVGGEERYLCWLVDEPEVRHWHGLGAGYAGRRPL